MSILGGDKPRPLQGVPVASPPLGAEVEKAWLDDPEHPINDKYFSGKKKGCVFYYNDENGHPVYVAASGSEKTDEWRGLEGVPTEDSLSAISIDPSGTELARTVTIPASPAFPVTIVPVHLNIPILPANFSGALLTANTDGTLTANVDIAYFKVTCMAIGKYASSKDIVLGLGIGDPATLPNNPGASTDVLPAGTYISRFRDIRRGEGAARPVTLQTPYFPVGKTRDLAALSGDKIFPVMWSEESTNTDVVFDDLIMAVEAVPFG